MHAKMPLVWFLVVFPTLALSSTSGASDIRTMCPHTRFCTDGPLKEIIDPDTRPCCMPCSCSEDCYKFESCCPDKPSDYGFRDIIPCRTQSNIYSNYLNRHVQSDLRDKFRVIDFCPEPTYDNPELQIAVSRCYHGTDLEDLSFVSDTNYIVYLNRFCAECHGVSNFTVWSLLIPCPDIFLTEFTSLGDLIGYVFSTCEVISKPPQDFDFRNSLCFIDKINECNLTGMWDFYDPEIERQCHVYDMPYAHSLSDAYANAFCFVCNNPHNTQLYSTCDLFEFSWSYRTMFYPFTAIVEIRDSPKLEHVQSDEETDRCTHTEVFDSLMQECKELICPAGTLASHGACIAVFDTVDGFCVTIQFGIQVSDVQKMSLNTNAGELGTGVKKLGRKIFKSFGIDCGISFVHVTENFSGKVFVTMATYSTSTCNYLKLLTAFDTLAKESNIRVVLDGVDMTLPMFHCQELSEIKTVLWYQNNIYCELILFTNKTVYCPSVEYELTSLVLAQLSSELASTIFKLSVHVGEDRYRICLGDYGKFWNTSSTAIGYQDILANIYHILIIYTVRHILVINY